MKRLIAPFAVGMAVLYLALAMGAAGCLFLHDQPTAAHHHNQSQATHSALCVWACQVNPTVATVSGTPSITILAVISLTGLFAPALVARDVSAASPSRAPPPSS